jgi:hypothetical protein
LDATKGLFLGLDDELGRRHREDDADDREEKRQHQGGSPLIQGLGASDGQASPQALGEDLMKEFHGDHLLPSIHSIDIKA